jgi:hypothetical protein
MTILADAFVAVLSPFTLMLVCYLKLSNNSIHQHPFHFIIHCHLISGY